MAAKNRNFRSYYYDKVGFRGVEEKKSLEILINEKPIDKTKLSRFCLMFTCPSMYREYVWKVLLGVIPVDPENGNAIAYQREAQYRELRHALEITRKIDENTPKPNIFAMLYLVGEGMLRSDWEQQKQDSHVQNIISLTAVFISMGTTDVGRFWLLRNFMHFQSKYHGSFKSQEELVETILKKEDPELYNHLCSVQAFKSLPIGKWFRCYFSDILHHRALERLLDKIIGGSCKPLPYVAATILVIFRRDLLLLKTAEAVVECVENVSEDISDVVVNKALDLCPNML